MNKATSWYSIQAKAEDKSPAEIAIYDEIGLWGITAKQFIDDLKGVGERDVNLTLHTPGGDVADGTAIYNALRRHNGNVTVTVDTLAASMGSVIALAGDTVRVVDNGFVMVHYPWMLAAGTAEEIGSAADALKKYEQTLVNIYVDRTGNDEETVRELLDAETYMSADEAVEKGFAHEVVKATKAAASIRDFKGALGRSLEMKYGPLDTAKAATEHPNKDKIMAENTDQILDLKAEIKSLKADLVSKDEQIRGYQVASTETDEKHADDLEKTRIEASQIVKLGKTHDKLELAIDAIENGDSVEAFKDKLLASFAEDSGREDPKTPDPVANADPSKAPKDKEEFHRVLSTLKGGQATAYFNEHKAILTK